MGPRSDKNVFAVPDNKARFSWYITFKVTSYISVERDLAEWSVGMRLFNIWEAAVTVILVTWRWLWYRLVVNYQKYLLVQVIGITRRGVLSLEYGQKVNCYISIFLKKLRLFFFQFWQSWRPVLIQVVSIKAQLSTFSLLGTAKKSEFCFREGNFNFISICTTNVSYRFVMDILNAICGVTYGSHTRSYRQHNHSKYCRNRQKKIYILHRNRHRTMFTIKPQQAFVPAASEKAIPLPPLHFPYRTSWPTSSFSSN